MEKDQKSYRAFNEKVTFMLAAVWKQEVAALLWALVSGSGTFPDAGPL